MCPAADVTVDREGGTGKETTGGLSSIKYFTTSCKFISACEFLKTYKLEIYFKSSDAFQWDDLSLNSLVGPR